MIDRGGHPSGNRPLQQYPGLHRRGVMAVLYAGQPIAKIKEAGREWPGRDGCMSRVNAIIALVIRIIVCLPRAVNHYRDNAITYKAQRDKNARELKGVTRTTTCRCVSVMLRRCKIHIEGVSRC